jgi:hypothetical protein
MEEDQAEAETPLSEDYGGMQPVDPDLDECVEDDAV